MSGEHPETTCSKNSFSEHSKRKICLENSKISKKLPQQTPLNYFYLVVVGVILVHLLIEAQSSSESFDFNTSILQVPLRHSIDQHLWTTPNIYCNQKLLRGTKSGKILTPMGVYTKPMNARHV